MTEPDDLGIVEESIVEDGFAAARRQMGRFNLAVFGLTGVGKSTLVNAVFGEELAQTGIGEPVTMGSRLYRHSSSQLGVFDTRGLEIGSDNAEILTELRAFIDGNRAGALADQIHVIWYCIRAGDRRIQDAEARFVREVAGLGIPVLLVMTQTPLLPGGVVHADAAALADSIRALRLPAWGDVHCINAKGDDFVGVPPFGLEGLLQATGEAAPAGVRSALAAAQVISAQQKRQQAAQRIAAAEESLQRKVFLPDVGRVWSELFAEIAAIYQMPDTEARDVLQQVRAAKRLRELLRRADTGLIVLAAGALASMGVPIDGVAPRPAEDDVPLAYGPQSSGGAQTQRIGTVLAAGPVTVALGDAWRETCEHYWSQSFPEPPTGVDPRDVADRFADRVYVRLPQRLRTWEERQRAKVEPPPPPQPAPGPIRKALGRLRRTKA